MRDIYDHCLAVDAENDALHRGYIMILRAKIG